MFVSSLFIKCKAIKVKLITYSKLKKAVHEGIYIERYIEMPFFNIFFDKFLIHYSFFIYHDYRLLITWNDMKCLFQSLTCSKFAVERNKALFGVKYECTISVIKISLHFCLVC